MNTFTVSNENEAWNLLEKTLKEGMPEGPFDLVFDNWPILEFKLSGDKFDSSLTVKVMESFIDLQKNLNRSYAQVRYNKPNAVGLTAAEKEELAIVVRVDKGSSLFQVDLQAALESFLKGVAGQMTGTEVVVTVLGTALITGGVICTKAYFEHQRQKRQADIVPLLSEQETKRLEIFAEALKKQEKLVPVYEGAEETYNKILKGASDAEMLEIGGQKIPQDVVQELVRQSRTRSEETQLNGWYRIQKVDSSKPEGFLIGVRSEEDGRTFTAKLEDKWVFRRDTNLGLLKDAEWEKQPIYLRINAKEVHDQVTQATILDVGEK